MKLNAAALARLPGSVRRPGFDPLGLACGIVHLGLGAFHRAHQAVFTEDAIEKSGGDWGIIGASLQHADVPQALAAQDGLYTVERLGPAPDLRVMGVIRQALFAPRQSAALLAALAAPTTHAVTLTISEKGYCLTPEGSLDLSHPDILADLAAPDAPRSAIGWLTAGLNARRKMGAGPLTILSCDNLQSNGEKLAAAVTQLGERQYPGLTRWIAAHTEFPLTLVDCIVPAADAAHRARVAHALGLTDDASVQREVYAQWVIQDRFAGPLPAWGAAGAQIVPDIAQYQRLKLHVLNAAHSALAYLGLPRGHAYVRQAIGDPQLRAFLEEMIAREIAPALALDVASYWRTVVTRFENPMIDHRLAQIAEDGSLKLPQRLFPMLTDNARTGREVARMGAVVRAWLDLMAEPGRPRDPANPWLADWARAGADKAAALNNEALFADAFRGDARLRAAILSPGDA